MRWRVWKVISYLFHFDVVLHLHRTYLVDTEYNWKYPCVHFYEGNERRVFLGNICINQEDNWDTYNLTFSLFALPVRRCLGLQYFWTPSRKKFLWIDFQSNVAITGNRISRSSSLIRSNNLASSSTPQHIENNIPSFARTPLTWVNIDKNLVGSVSTSPAYCTVR